MDLTAWLLRLTPPRPLVVTMPGGTEARLAVERAVRDRGWRPATSPAQANFLIVAGAFGDELKPHLRRTWLSIPSPRVYATIEHATETASRLADSLDRLHDLRRQRRDAARPRREQRNNGAVPANQHAHDAHHGHAGQHAHAGHTGHAGHDMGGMELPGGVPMADRAADRDGLTLDQLHVPLGPVLPLWPAGLIVHTRLQGDVVQHATVERISSGGRCHWSAADAHRRHRLAARRLDSCCRLLALAGWLDAAAQAQRLRDDLLHGVPPLAVLPSLTRWGRRVRRSGALRWLLDGVGATTDLDPPAALAGDALTRFRLWVDWAIQAADPDEDPPPLPDRHETRWIVDNLPALLAGTEFASARLVIASLDPDLDLLAPDDAHHG